MNYRLPNTPRGLKEPNTYSQFPGGILVEKRRHLDCIYICKGKSSFPEKKQNKSRRRQRKRPMGEPYGTIRFLKHGLGLSSCNLVDL